jgi:hypothetical protein
MRIVKETSLVGEAFFWLAARSKSVGGVTAGVESADNSKVPAWFHGQYVVTGKGVRYECTNLVRAVVTLRSVRNAENLWRVGADGKRTRLVHV